MHAILRDNYPDWKGKHAWLNPTLSAGLETKKPEPTTLAPAAADNLGSVVPAVKVTTQEKKNSLPILAGKLFAVALVSVLALILLLFLEDELCWWGNNVQGSILVQLLRQYDRITKCSR